ncbi:MAG: carbohydrate binding family 9 domain-containing protein [Verrucomicrobia bacterium]|nr:carbohydrate binding family 9 domain-containing protein [Verrucomicrobiota bacterium]
MLTAGLLSAAVLFGLTCQAEVERPFLQIPHTENPPSIDGRLDDPCWRTAAVLTNFTQVLPLEGAPPSEGTEVRVLYTREQLFFGIRCHDHEPAAILAKEMRHDTGFSSDDKIEVVIDTFGQQREGYFFAVNPAGARTEGLIEDFSRENSLWDTVWQARTRIDAQGWTAEVAIPFKSLSFDRTQTAWGCNVERVIRRKQERVRWTGIARAQQVATLADLGELRGLTNLHQGLGLEAKASLSVKHATATQPAKDDWDIKPSLDLTYYLTPALKANATFNTDFAETEVDDRVVNLTRFPLFFPEKRDFFLQDSDLFRFAGLSSSVLTPFYTRRIGLAPDGQPVDILAGGRVTGRFDGARLAVLGVQQADHCDLGSKSLFVGRVSKSVLEESEVGGLFTYGDPRSRGDAALGGADFNYRNTRLPANKTLRGHAWFMGSTSESIDGQDVAGGMDLSYPNEPFGASVAARHIGEKFDPALGFVRRRDIRYYQGSANYTWRPNAAWLRSIYLDVRPNFTTDLNNRLVAEDHDLPSLTFTTPAGDQLWLLYSNERDVLDAPFEIQPGIMIPRGDYRMNQFQASLSTSDARAVGVEFKARTAEFYTGRRREFFGGLDLRPVRYVTAQIGYALTEVRLAEGAFDVRLPTARLNLALTPDLTWTTLAQYDNLSDNLGFFSRIRWTFRPGSDLFFVVNQGFAFDDWRFHQSSRDITLKVGVTVRF